MKKLVLFGPPGSGKGTLASLILKVLPNIVHVSTGDIFRENLKNKTPLGLKAKEYMEKGELVPDEIVIKMVESRLNQEDVKQYGFMLDGFPRNTRQTRALDGITQIDTFLLLEVERNIIKKRILGRFGCGECGEIYNKYTLPPKIQKGTNQWICDKCGAEIEFKQRSDDTEETLEKRLNVYEENAKPIINYYQEKGLLKKVDAENTLEMSADDIKKIIEL
ncbi:MAG: adenylate kinase [Candidatus Hodarchaeota archaeon]